SWRRRGSHEPLRRYQRLRLPGLEGNVLPGETSREDDARVLRRALPGGGEQLYLPQDSRPEAPGGVDDASAAGVPVRPQGPATDHAPQAVEGRRRISCGVRRRREGVDGPTRPGPVPTAAELQ